MRFVATEVYCKDLKSGDLFSSAGPSYWERPSDGSIGERVYVRTEVPCPPDQTEEKIFRITTED